MILKFLYFPFMHLRFMSIPSAYIRTERDYDFLYPSHIMSRCPIMSSPSFIEIIHFHFLYQFKVFVTLLQQSTKVIFHPFNTDKNLLSLNKTKTK